MVFSLSRKWVVSEDFSASSDIVVIVELESEYIEEEKRGGGLARFGLG
jgi:hypothetical protein